MKSKLLFIDSLACHRLEPRAHAVMLNYPGC